MWSVFINMPSFFRFLNLYNHLEFCCIFAHYFFQDIPQVRNFSFTSGLHLGNAFDMTHVLLKFTFYKHLLMLTEKLFTFLVCQGKTMSTSTYHGDDFQFYKVQSKISYLINAAYIVQVISSIFLIIIELKLLFIFIKNKMLHKF